ncbi:helix-turn-helix domain-containing protein [Caballeronia sp. LZ065]|uniref:GlxA family transcriptional regulator n=1 Tax=Caballeronia sp. LZ065 TaxID=3038571 RepID=UPI002861C9B6|nr:helix-turn-helix domain-containing protein [Caballeronia sp. LZ065]MDR5780144.1 helix-turn-helix domain-containing protein [Caballeronia sp. LZ065]
MPYANLEPAVMGWTPPAARTSQTEVRRIAILLFDGFSLLGAGIVAEVFHMANELSSARSRVDCTYDVRFLSVEGGNVACSSSVRVWTDGLDARHYGGFDALFVAGGRGAEGAAKDDRIVEWLRRVQTKTTVVRAISEGRKVLDAAGIGPMQDPQARYGGAMIHLVREEQSADAGDRYESMKGALLIVKRDLGIDVSRSVAERLMPGSAAKLVSILGDSGAASAGDKIRAAARWLQDNCERPISGVDAAQVAAMSERNFLRRFKIEMGITPSDYLLQARLAVTCALLTDSELPVDKIARRSGMGNGDRLAKIFRKRLLISPTEYRTQSRREANG